MQLDKAIQTRKSVRRFKSKKVSWRDIIEAIDSARYAPMAGNNFSLRFIVVDDKEKISQIAQTCQQDFISETDYVVVACSKTDTAIRSYGKRGEIYTRQQAGSGIQNFLLKINEAGLSTCWIGHFTDSKIKNILKIPENTNVEAIFPIGYEFPGQKPSHKINIDSILFFNKYGEKKMKPVREVKA